VPCSSSEKLNIDVGGALDVALEVDRVVANAGLCLTMRGLHRSSRTPCVRTTRMPRPHTRRPPSTTAAARRSPGSCTRLRPRCGFAASLSPRHAAPPAANDHVSPLPARPLANRRSRRESVTRMDASARPASRRGCAHPRRGTTRFDRFVGRARVQRPGVVGATTATCQTKARVPRGTRADAISPFATTPPHERGPS